MQVTTSSESGDAPSRDVFTVSRLNREARALLEDSFPLIWVEGELSNLARPASGHWYFTLKDAQAQVRCAMFRQRNLKVGFEPENGAQVLLRARVSLYEGRGEFQLIIEHMEAAGDGALQRAFEALKRKLDAEGLFDPERKRPLPAWPGRVGVITSPTGAALRDIVSVLKRRFPVLQVLVYPVPVQGEGASAKIAAALRAASASADCDVLIVARGGGSLEDLQAFNDEAVARAIHACAIPVVSGVGHEIDFTIADFVADRRAPTPSAAAELVSPDQTEFMQTLIALDNRLRHLLDRNMNQQWRTLNWLLARLKPQHPGLRLRQQAQRLDELEQRLRLANKATQHHLRAHLAALTARLDRRSPLSRLALSAAHLDHLKQRLIAAGRSAVHAHRQRLAELSRALQGVSPLATLGRGYAIVTRHGTTNVIHNARDVLPGDAVDARLARGRLICRVEDIEP